MSIPPIHVLSRAVIIADGYILLCKALRYSPNFYFLPGGHVEPGESARNAVLRELQEETGIKGEVKQFLGCLEHSFPDNCHTHEYNFLFQTSANSFDPKIPVLSKEPHIAFQWVKLDQLKQMDLKPEKLSILLETWIKSNHDNGFSSSMD